MSLAFRQMASYMGTELSALLDRQEPLKRALQTKNALQYSTALVRNTLHYGIHGFYVLSE